MNNFILYKIPKNTDGVKFYSKKRTKKTALKLNRTIKLKKNLIREDLSTKSMNMKSYNSEFINALGTLYNLMIAKGEPFRARAYKKAQETLINYKEPITTLDSIKSLPSIGDTILKKMDELMKTGKISAIEKYKNDPMILFTNIYGVGPKKASELIKKEKITTLEMLKEKQNEVLNDKQKIGLHYYEPLQKRIPRSEIDTYKSILDSVFKNVYIDGSEFMIVGSYRREKSNSGDIDIIITNKQNNIKIFNDFIDSLIEKNIVIEILSRGNKKSLAISQINESIPRRIDFLYAPPDEYSFATLYFTGSATFNTVMRQHALNLGYTMNEHGLYNMVNKVKQDKVDILFPDEKSIFDFLGLVYKEPKDRIDGNSVVIKKEKMGFPKETPKNKTMKKKKTSINTYLRGFQKSGLDFIEILKEETLVNMVSEANKQYYNDYPILTDNEYDILKEFVEKKFPKNKIINEVGAPVEKNKVRLPYFMGSMDKIKPDTNYLKTWKQTYKGPYIISAKLDGVSGLYSTEGETPKLYTRGNGVIGQDVSHLIPYLNLPSKRNITIRGEFIMTKEVFDTTYKNKASNARNFVSGVINAKKVDSKIKNIDFVAYEVIKPSLKPSEQMEFLETLNVKTVLHEPMNYKELTNDNLSTILMNWRDSYTYIIDGIIVIDDEIYPRKNENPKHAFAFKMVLSDQVAEAKVLDVLWTPSKDGYLKPRIKIEPIIIGGAKIEYATAFNGAYVETNKIGVGSIIRLVRSGDVIPHILETIVPASVAKMPDVPYKWNESHIDILLIDALNNEVVKTKNITGFFTGLDVAGLGEGNVKRLMKAGFDSVPKIIAMSQSDFLKAEGFKEKMATKLHKNIHTKLDNLSLSKLMTVSNLFGRGMGEKRIEEILKTYPDILISKESEREKINKIMALKGFAEKTAKLFVSNIDLFLDFVIQTKLNIDLVENVVGKPPVSGKLSGKTIVFSGFRDKELERNIKDEGGEVSNSLTKTTNILLVKDKDDETTKTQKAKKNNILILSVDEFNETYF